MFSGFVGDQREYNDRMNNKTHPPVLKSGPGMIEPVERFRLNNLSFAGPVIMGVGGKKFETVLRSFDDWKPVQSCFLMIYLLCSITMISMFCWLVLSWSIIWIIIDTNVWLSASFILRICLQKLRPKSFDHYYNLNCSNPSYPSNSDKMSFSQDPTTNFESWNL